jgi:hypothetical protein
MKIPTTTMTRRTLNKTERPKPRCVAGFGSGLGSGLGFGFGSVVELGDEVVTIS